VLIFPSFVDDRWGKLHRRCLEMTVAEGGEAGAAARETLRSHLGIRPEWLAIRAGLTRPGRPL
jgi:hypothetical protein